MSEKLIYYNAPMGNRYPQVTLEQLLYQNNDDLPQVTEIEKTATRTIATYNPPPFNTSLALIHLINFKNRYKDLYETPRSDLYYSFHIPKRSGGLRRIDAPNEPLKIALKELSNLLINVFGNLYHTNAYAYISGRTTRMALIKHQYNQSKWYAKFDFSNFFGSTTLEFVITQLSSIYPYNYLFESPENVKLLTTILDLCFLNGGLPQGTPISPMLTNLIMLPIDYELSRQLHPRHVYTRYADDMQISSRANFDINYIQNNVILATLSRFKAPFILNTKKTRYLSRNGPNHHLGLVINKDNNITIGHEKKHQFKAMLFNLMMDRKRGVHWQLHDLQVLQGYVNYYRQIEPEIVEDILMRYGRQFGYDIEKFLKYEIVNATA